MSNLVKHAERELDLVGMGDPDADYDGMLKDAVLEIVRVFSRQGHSGMSASMVTAMAEKLLRYEPLCPLTGADNEWWEIPAGMRPENTTHQNVRCGRVFKRVDGTAYDVEGQILREPDGTCVVGGSVEVTFPYIPTTEYVDVPNDRDGRR